MYQIELEFRYFREFQESYINDWASFYGVKVLKGMLYIFRCSSESSLYSFLKRLGLEDKASQIRRLR